jgi:tetratricopeptide (TPR) repeat protein
MPQLAEHLVGRTAELSSIDETLGELERGRALTVELLGEPGIGKTRLLAELARRADARGHLVLSGSASELERDLPFWVFVDALDEYLIGLEPRVLARFGDDVRAELARVLPSLAADAPAHAPTVHDERYRTHGAVCELLGTLAATKPLVMTLDDVHWADAASVELLGGLLRRPPAAPVLLALALRPRQIPARLAAALDRAHRDGSLNRIQLGALSRAEAFELIGDDAQYDEGGGNPFYLLELARSSSRRAAHGARLAGVDVPAMVLAALDEELGLLSPTARRTLEGAAVAGDPFEPDLAAAAAARDLPETIDALDELLRLDLVRETDVPRRFRFRHPIVRLAVYERAPGGWRLGAHERCAAALVARGAPASALAHHVERSARQGDDAAITTLREAGESAAPLAPASAANWFGGALRLLPEHAPAADHIALLTARADALIAVGEYAEAHAAVLEALAQARDDTPADRVALITRCARVEQFLGRHEQAHTRLLDALEALPRDPSSESIALMAHLAYDGFFRMRFKPMVEWAERAAADARARGDEPVITWAVALLALAQACAGATPRRSDTVRRPPRSSTR